jgi:aminopeptidase N
MATTFSAAAYARKIFPCFDEPAFKAKFHVAITSEKHFVTLANTRISGSDDLAM